MDSSNYWNMIDWPNSAYSEPPILMNFSLEELNSMVLEPNSNSAVFQAIKKFPCHTQAVERGVKLLTETALKVYGEEKRDGVVRNTLLSRKNMPYCESKKDLKGLNK